MLLLCYYNGICINWCAPIPCQIVEMQCCLACRVQSLQQTLHAVKINTNNFKHCLLAPFLLLLRILISFVLFLPLSFSLFYSQQLQSNQIDFIGKSNAVTKFYYDKNQFNTVFYWNFFYSTKSFVRPVFFTLFSSLSTLKTDFQHKNVN